METEIRSHDDFNEEYLSRYDDIASENDIDREKHFNDRYITQIDGATLYILVRSLQPDTVLETGVCHGHSSAHILKAMEQNSQGNLHSIDLPSQPDTFEHGYVIPENLRDKWNLHLGDSSDLLPDLRDEIAPIDMFHHDSLHTYDHMRWEFNQIYEVIEKSGIITSHDVIHNNAFQDFAIDHDLEMARVVKEGIAVK